MNINVFFKHLPEVTNVVSKSGYLNLISQLHSNVSNIVQLSSKNRPQVNHSQVNNVKKQILNSIIELNKIYTDIETNLVSINEKFAFQKLGLDKIGKANVNVVFQSLISQDKLIDYVDLRNSLSKYLNKIKNLTQFSATSSAFFLSNEHNDLDVDSITINFRENADIKYLKELTKESRNWNQILHCFALLSESPEDETKIESIEKGSLLLTLTTASGIILALAKASNFVSETILNYYEIRKKSLELKNLKVESIDKIVVLLEKEASLKVDLAAEEIAEKLLLEYKNEDNEVKTALFLSIRKIIRFINNGGKIEPRLTDKTYSKNKDLINSISNNNNLLIEIESELKTLDTNGEIIKLIDKMKSKDENPTS